MTHQPKAKGRAGAPIFKFAKHGSSPCVIRNCRLVVRCLAARLTPARSSACCDERRNIKDQRDLAVAQDGGAADAAHRWNSGPSGLITVCASPSSSSTTGRRLRACLTTTMFCRCRATLRDAEDLAQADKRQHLAAQIQVVRVRCSSPAQRLTRRIRRPCPAAPRKSTCRGGPESRR